MAALAEAQITRRTTSNLGTWKHEAIEFTDDTTQGDYHIPTKVGQILWYSIRGVDNFVIDFIPSLNSQSASDIQDDKGDFYFEASALASGGEYELEVIGRGR